MNLKKIVLLLIIMTACKLTAFSQFILTSEQSKQVAKDLKRLEFCDSTTNYHTMQIEVYKAQIGGYKRQTDIINTRYDKAVLKLKVRGFVLKFGIPLGVLGGFYLARKVD